MEFIYEEIPGEELEELLEEMEDLGSEFVARRNLNGDGFDIMTTSGIEPQVIEGYKMFIEGYLKGRGVI